MLKMTGALLIFGAGVWAWRQQAAARRRSLETLADLITTLRRMGEEVRMRRTALPRLLSQLQRGRTSAVALFLQSVAAGIQMGRPLPDSWGEAVEALPLREGDRALLREIGGDLHGDEENICKVILLTCDQLSKSLEAARGSQPEEEKRASALWLSGAALLVILLI